MVGTFNFSMLQNSLFRTSNKVNDMNVLNCSYDKHNETYTFSRSNQRSIEFDTFENFDCFLKNLMEMNDIDPHCNRMGVVLNSLFVS